MRELLCVFVGGGLGSALRFMVSMWWRHLSLHPRFEGNFSSTESMLMPWPTLAVNVVGCLLIGLFYTYSDRWGLSPEVRLLLTTGFCGGLTTFSTFSWETVSLFQGGHYMMAIAYVLLSIVLGLVAVFVPIWVRG